MNPDDVRKILLDFQVENSKSLESIRIMVKEFDKISSIGKKYIDKRIDYYCADIKYELDKAIDDNIKESNQIYSKADLLEHKYKKCLALTKNRFVLSHEKTTNYISEFKKFQKKQLDKCFVLNHGESPIKECLKKKIVKKEEKIYYKIKDYHSQLKEFSKDIFI